MVRWGGDKAGRASGHLREMTLEGRGRAQQLPLGRRGSSQPRGRCSLAWREGPRPLALKVREVEGLRGRSRGGWEVAHYGHPTTPACPQEHPEHLLGASGHLGAEPRAAAQVHHAGHGHHAQAGEAACVPGRPGMGAVHSQLGWDGGPPGVAISSMRGPPPQLEGALDFGFWASYSSPIPHRQVPGLKVLSSQGPRVEILAKNLRVKDQMPQGAPR